MLFLEVTRKILISYSCAIYSFEARIVIDGVNDSNGTAAVCLPVNQIPFMESENDSEFS